MTIRGRRAAFGALAMAALLAGCVAAEQASRKSPESNVQTVQMTAERFKYTPDEITVKKGVPVDLVLTTKDRVHGFYVPELGLRAEIKPGETEHVRFTPDKAGKFTMECDIFCGEGHESMDGTITVE